MFTILKAFRKNVKGATAIEYGLIAALIAVGCIAALRTVGENLNAKMTNVADGLASSPSS